MTIAIGIAAVVLGLAGLYWLSTRPASRLEPPTIASDRPARGDNPRPPERGATRPPGPRPSATAAPAAPTTLRGTGGIGFDAMLQAHEEEVLNLIARKDAAHAMQRAAKAIVEFVQAGRAEEAVRMYKLLYASFPSVLVDAPARAALFDACTARSDWNTVAMVLAEQHHLNARAPGHADRLVQTAEALCENPRARAMFSQFIEWAREAGADHAALSPLRERAYEARIAADRTFDDGMIEDLIDTEYFDDALRRIRNAAGPIHVNPRKLRLLSTHFMQRGRRDDAVAVLQALIVNHIDSEIAADGLYELISQSLIDDPTGAGAARWLAFMEQHHPDSPAYAAAYDLVARATTHAPEG